MSACSSTQSEIPHFDKTQVMDIITLSEERASAGLGVKGVFHLPIKASGVKREFTYLNTEDDYRDRRNITIAIYPQVTSAFIKQYGTTPETYFINKTIEVTGEAKRVKIYFNSNGKYSGKYYFQTHIDVSSLQQIKIVNE